MIITTRNATYATLASNSNHHVDALLFSDSVGPLLESSSYQENEENRSYAGRIAEALGHLPLALTHAAGYITVHGCLENYLEIYESSRDKLSAISSQHLPQDYQLSAQATVQLSFDRLSRSAREMLVLFSHMDVVSIPRSMIAEAARRRFLQVPLLEASSLPPTHMTVDQAAYLTRLLCPSGEWLDSDFYDIVEECLQYSLLRIVSRADYQYYSMHVIVQSYLKDSSINGADFPNGRHVARLLASTVTIDRGLDTRTFNARLISHIKLIRIDDVVEAGDLYAFGFVLFMEWELLAAQQYFERSFSGWKQLLGENHPITCYPLCDLAAIAATTSINCTEETVEFFRKVIRIWRQSLGNEHKDTLEAMDNLQNACTCLGNYEEGLIIGKEVLEKRQRLLGEDHLDTIMAMGNLSLTYSSLGQSREALELAEKALEVRRRIQGEDHVDTLVEMANLALEYANLDRYADALKLQEKVLDLRKTSLGDEHLDTARAMRDMGSTYYQMGRYSDASKLLEKAVEIFSASLGEVHPDTLAITGNLAVIYQKLRQFASALSLNEKTVNGWRDTVGEEDVRTLLAMSNLIWTLGSLREYQRMKEALRNALPLYERILGADHSDTRRLRGWDNQVYNF